MIKKFTTSNFQGAWFTFDEDRMKLRSQIQEYLRADLRDPTGRLQVKEDGPHWVGKTAIGLSYAHTSGSSLLVYSHDAMIGVDVERKDRVFGNSPMAIAERYFHPEEVKNLKAIQPVAFQAQVFLHLWVQKEAYAKLTRLGLVNTIRQSTQSHGKAKFELVPVMPKDLIAWVAMK